MGMASSQVRLLMITNRMHDIEYKAQCLQNAKILLGHLEDDAYQKYNAALEGANRIVIGGQAAQSTFMLHDLVEALGVGLQSSDGRIHVSTKFLEAFQKVAGSNSENKYRDFVWYMKSDSANNGDGSLSDIPKEPNKNDFYTKEEQYNEWEAYPSGVAGTSQVSGASGHNVTKTRKVFDEQAYNNALAIYNSYLSCANDGTYRQLFDIVSKAPEGTVVADMDDMSMDQIAYLCTNEGYTLLNKNAIGAAAYAQNQYEEAYDTVVDKSNPFNYSVEVQEDKTAVAKASAEYEMELRKIDRKEKQYDTELAKLESERQALDKEREGIKKVMEDNIDRTFGLFS